MERLGDLRVVDLSSTIAGAYCALLLAQSGARVVAVEPPGGHPLRRRRLPGAQRAGVLFDHLRTGVEDAPLPSWGDVDVVIVDQASDLDAGSLADDEPRLIVVAITPYGCHGPLAGRPGNDFTAQADSGALLVRGLPADAPVAMGGDLVEWVAGAYAAAAVVATWHGTRLTGRGDLLDLSLCETALVTGTLFSGLFDDVRGRPPRVGPARTVETPSIEPTRDGYIGVTTNTPAQFDGFLDAIGRADLVGDPRFAGPAQRLADWETWSALVRDATSAIGSEELLSRLVERRVPAAVVNDAAGVLRLEQARVRGAFVPSTDGSYERPRAPWRVSPTGIVGRPRSRHRAAADLPLSGVRVLDLTAWWAGPSCTQLLAAFGAEVVHVEGPTRPDGMRMTGLAVGPHERWYDRGHFFHQINTNKRSLALDVSTPDGRDVVLDLVADCDVLVENFTPRVLESFGLGADVLHRANPRLVVTRLPAFGLDGPWRDQPGFAQTMEQITGMAWVTGHRADQPRVPRGPCDPNGGMHGAIATLVALLDAERTGEGSLVEVSLFDAALAIGAEQIVECSANGVVPQRDGNRSPHAVPQGLYRCDGPEQWLAVSCPDDRSWWALCDVVKSEVLDRWREVDADQRRAHHDAIDAELARWTSARTPDAAVTELVAAGVCAAVGRDPRDAVGHPQLIARGFFESVDIETLGRIDLPSLPFRSRRIPRWTRSAAPAFGEGNAEVLAQAGRDEVEIADLFERRIVSSRPLL